MNNLEKVGNLCRIAGLAIEGVVKLKEAEFRRYQNMEHIMTEENEVLIPSKEESYMFDKNVWDVIHKHNFIILTKKKINQVINDDSN